jgi:hypothetical protein
MYMKEDTITIVTITSAPFPMPGQGVPIHCTPGQTVKHQLEDCLQTLNWRAVRSSRHITNYQNLD